MTIWETEDGEIRDIVLNVTNSFYIWGEVENPSRLQRFFCWMNGWLPFDWRISISGRFFRL